MTTRTTKSRVLPETKTYMEIYYPGFFLSETTDKLVKSRAIPKKRPEGAFAIRFYDREEIENLDGEILKGKKKNESHRIYWGQEFTCAEIKKQFPNENILYGNIHGNGYKRGVRTVLGNWQPLEPDDVVIRE